MLAFEALRVLNVQPNEKLSMPNTSPPPIASQRIANPLGQSSIRGRRLASAGCEAADICSGTDRDADVAVTTAGVSPA